jgi:hypothetical protein
MILYLVSYDIEREPVATALREKLKELRAKPILESEWLLESDATAEMIFVNLAGDLDHNKNSLMVVELCRNAVYTKNTLLTDHHVVNAIFERSAHRC